MCIRDRAYTTPFELLVAVILSAQATDVGVNKATRRLYPVANTAAAILALGEEGLKPYISTIGPVSYTHLHRAVFGRQRGGGVDGYPDRAKRPAARGDPRSLPLIAETGMRR